MEKHGRRALTYDHLARQLESEGLVSADQVSAIQAAAGRDTGEVSWSITFFSGFAGWIAALFLAVALSALSAIFIQSGGGFILGAIGLYGAREIQKRYGASPFGNQVALVLCLTAQGWIAASFMAQHFDYRATALFMMGLQIAVIPFFDNQALRFLATLFAVICLMIALSPQGDFRGQATIVAFLLPLAALTALETPSSAKSLWNERVRVPVSYGLVVGVLLIYLGSLTLGSYTRWLGRDLPVAGAALALMGIFVLASREDRKGGLDPAMLVGLAVVIGVCALTRNNPGVLGGTFAIFAGFRQNRRVLMGLGWLFLAGYLFHFYQSMEMSLMDKSISLCATGGVLLAVRLLIKLTAKGKSR